MNVENIITIKVADQFFATQAEMADFVAARLAERLEFWPEHMKERERSVNLHKVIPREAIIYEVNYLRTRCAAYED